jgi:hypothetical protein
MSKKEGWWWESWREQAYRRGTSALELRLNLLSGLHVIALTNPLTLPTATLTWNRVSERAITCSEQSTAGCSYGHQWTMIASTDRAHDSPPSSPHAPALPNPGEHHSRTTIAARTVDTPRPQIDTISDRATAAFVRRTLCSHNVLLGNGEKGRTTPRPIEDVLPPLTSSNEVDLQLYGIISVIIKEFVQTWYSKITADHVFVNEVLQIIAHCTRGLEQRLRKVDLEALLLDEIPELLEVHFDSKCFRSLNINVTLV